MRFLKRIQRALAIRYQRRAMSAALQDPRQHLPVRRVVVRDQDVQPFGRPAAPRVILQANHAFARFLARGDRMQHVEQLPLVERHFEHGAEAGRQRRKARHIRRALHREDHRRRRVGRGAAKALRELQILALGIEQRAVVWPREADLGDEARHALVRAGDRHRGGAPSGERLLERFALQLRKTDQQYAHPRELSRARARALGLLLQLGFEPEGAAQADRALQADPAAHQLDQLLGDRRPEARAAEAARGGLLGLREALENPLLRLGRDADPGIAHRELEAHAGLALALAADVHGDAAMLGELHRIAGEIDQHLAQVVRIAAHRGGYLGHDRDHELDALRRRLR